MSLGDEVNDLKEDINQLDKDINFVDKWSNRYYVIVSLLIIGLFIFTNIDLSSHKNDGVWSCDKYEEDFEPHWEVRKCLAVGPYGACPNCHCEIKNYVDKAPCVREVWTKK